MPTTYLVAPDTLETYVGQAVQFTAGGRQYRGILTSYNKNNDMATFLISGPGGQQYTMQFSRQDIIGIGPAVLPPPGQGGGYPGGGYPGGYPGGGYPGGGYPGGYPGGGYPGGFPGGGYPGGGYPGGFPGGGYPGSGYPGGFPGGGYPGGGYPGGGGGIGGLLPWWLLLGRAYQTPEGHIVITRS